MTRRRQKRILWITDPWETLDHSNDTTLRLAHEALKLGAKSYWCDTKSLRLVGPKIAVDAGLLGESGTPFLSKSLADDFDQIHYRTDPPVDLHYLHPLHFLSFTRSEIVNPVSILLGANEKLEANALPRLMPRTLAASRWKDLRDFGRKLGKAVLKPLNQAQSKGVTLVHFNNETEAQDLLSAATQGFQLPVILQEYLPGITEGEKRLWFIDGSLLAYAKKLPMQGDFRVNLDQGSKVVSCELNRGEKAAAQQIGRHLRKRKIRLAAVDLIEGKITDFNFTSPGMIVQMEKISGENLAAKILKRLLK